MLTALREFGANGALAGIRPLEAFRDVTDRLGQPEKSGRISDDRPWPRWFTYGDVVVETCACRVINKVSVRTWYDTVRIPADRPGEFHTLVPATTFQEIRSAFSGASVKWHLLAQEHTLPQFTVETEPTGFPGVVVHFTFVTDEIRDISEALLHSVFAIESVHACT